jgi:hypothetical protein
MGASIGISDSTVMCRRVPVAERLRREIGEVGSGEEDMSMEGRRMDGCKAGCGGCGGWREAGSTQRE